MKLALIVHDIRSCHNVGSLLRTAEGLGVDQVYLTGYTPYPASASDSRLPHIRDKLDHQIHKTALGAENLISWAHLTDADKLLDRLKSEGYQLVGLEQVDGSLPLATFRPKGDVALIIGREVEGIDRRLLAKLDVVVEIAMRGQKESFNVVQATAMALYHLRSLPA